SAAGGVSRSAPPARESETRPAPQSSPTNSPTTKQKESQEEPAPKIDPLWEAVDDLKTQLSWRPSIHDRRFQLRVLIVALVIATLYLCFHFGMTFNNKLAVASEQQRLQSLFQQCLDHDGSPKHLIFSGIVQEDPSVPPDSQQPHEAIAKFGDSYTFPAWSEISKFPDPTIFVGKLTASDGTNRLVIVTLDLAPAEARPDAGNVGIHVSTYAADLPLSRESSGEAQLNIYLKPGATFRAFEGSRESGKDSVSFSIEADKKTSTIHASLQPDGMIAIVDDAKEITHETEFYELDRSAGN
ncbi:MAG: hypothetical protein ABSF29_15040, partial [Tepidisphaeraceae bacterium]